MCTPTLVFFVFTLADITNAFAQAASVFVFAAPIILLARHSALTADALRHALLLLLLLTGPLWFSISVHLNAYNFEDFATAVVRTVGLTIYLMTVIVLSGHPDGTRLLRRAFILVALVFATFLLIISALFPNWHYGRFDPAGIHPNWWGEITVTLTFAASFLSKRWLRYSLWFIALAMVVLVQNRSALGHILIIISFATLAHEGIRRLLIIGLITLLVIIPLAVLLDLVLFDGVLFIRLFDWVANTVLLLNDPLRGLSSGVTGRDVGWLFAIEIVSQHPWTGVGFSRANSMLKDFSETADIHNGHLLLLADLGLFIYMFFAIFMIGALIKLMRRGHLIFFGYAFGFIFFSLMLIPRAINLSVLPMLFWMTVILAWLPAFGGGRNMLCLPRQTNSGTTGPSSLPARSISSTNRSGIGSRWVNDLPVEPRH